MASEVTSVPDLDLERYAGTWHEIARLPMFFQRNCKSDIKANYTLQPDGTVLVENSSINFEDKTISAQGVARRVDPKEPAKLQVRFAPSWLSWLPFVWADYWVIALDDDYKWAVVGQPGRKYLWILSRSPSLDKETFENLKAKAESMGYDLSTLIVSGKVE